MCGIAGYVGEEAPRAKAYVRRLTDALARRGPDGEGFEQWPLAVLGHRRLAIFDLSEAGRQPMSTLEGDVSVVFNGAIYNFLELRRELEQMGARFRSNTDTEVLLHGYQLWGLKKTLARLRGMFAFGLWDQREERLFLIRDRLGVKPLLYAFDGRRLGFASTAQALRAAGLAGELDEAGLLDYLEFGFVTDEHSIYRGVQKVPAGAILEWQGGRIVSVSQYWQPAPVDSRPRKFDDVVDEAEERFLEAVRLRLEADVPVGALLSGGVDSSLVCWAIAKLNGNIRTFTVSTPGDALDESSDAAATARQLGLPHQLIELQEPAEDRGRDIPAAIEELVAAYGEPFACASALGMLRVSKAVKPHATVLVTGDGGDDVFLGYPEHKHFWMAERLARRVPTPFARLWPAVARALPTGPPWTRRARHFLDYATGGLGAVTQIHDGLPFYKGMLGERLRGHSPKARDIPFSTDSARNLSAEFLAYDRSTRFTGEYLTKVDGASMYWGLEARSPFLDHQLWNFAAALPMETRLHGGALKAVLRAIAQRRLGTRVAQGAKRGFHIPAARWLVGKWRPSFEALLAESRLEREGIIDARAARSAIQAATQAGRAPNQLWYLFVLEAWMHRKEALVLA